MGKKCYTVPVLKYKSLKKMLLQRAISYTFFDAQSKKKKKNSNLDMIQIGLRYRKHIRKCFSMSFRDQDGLF